MFADKDFLYSSRITFFFDKKNRQFQFIRGGDACGHLRSAQGSVDRDMNKCSFGFTQCNHRILGGFKSYFWQNKRAITNHNNRLHKENVISYPASSFSKKPISSDSLIKLLVVTWGVPWRVGEGYAWDGVDYVFEDLRVRSRCSLSLLLERIDFDEVLVLILNTAFNTLDISSYEEPVDHVNSRYHSFLDELELDCS